MLKKTSMITIFGFFLFTLTQWASTTTTKDVLQTDRFEILAHRGVHVNWEKGAYDRATGCEARYIYKPTHEFIENTLESIEAAFNFGATIVEIDIRRSNDNQLVVFHDYMLECRTNGTGNITERSLEYLKSLDIGYGYTYDNGKTYPFRGKGIGKMPTLEEVLQEFPDKKFLIDHKDGAMETAELLVNIIKSLPPQQQKLIYYWGPDETYEYIREETPVTRFFCTRRQIKKWFKKYLVTFGLSGFPEESKGLVMGMPSKYTKIVWGWPHRFLNKVHKAGAKFYLIINSEEDAVKYLDIPVDGVVTDYIELIGKYYDIR